jgi:DNA-directed RNA polymerase specialized sigma24 family protein
MNPTKENEDSNLDSINEHGHEFEAPQPANDTQLQDDFDDLVRRASDGDRRAVGAIAIALGPSLLAEARTALKELDEDAADVLQDFFLFLLERRSPFNRASGPALHWMHRMVRTIAQQRRREARREARHADEQDDD